MVDLFRTFSVSFCFRRVASSLMRRRVFRGLIMYVSASQTRQLSHCLDVLTRPGDVRQVRARIIQPLADLLNADYVASLVWDESLGRFRDGVCCRTDAGHLRAYEDEYQFTDPIAPLLHQRRYPTLVSEVIPQKTLVKTEFFDRFLGTGAMYWGVNLYAHDGQRDLGDLRIWRSRAKQNYDKNEIGLLRLLYPSLVNAFGAERRACELAVEAPAKVQSPRSEASDEFSLEENLRRRFGLSQREAEVARMTSLGCTDKEIARRTGVAYTTVRTYLANALRKTGHRNRKALIAAFAHFARD
jgi:DNA-binding CsgD family transcriptional regulator